MCKKENIIFVGKIPYDTSVITAINNNKPVTDFEGKASDEIKLIYKKVIDLLLNEAQL